TLVSELETGSAKEDTRFGRVSWRVGVMAEERRPGDEQGGLETSSELRHGDHYTPLPEAHPELGYDPVPRRPGPSPWLVWATRLLAALLGLGFVVGVLVLVQ
ncbi:MAG: hypothetical protein ACRDNG_00650, partial [Gaiellaceae bacterium]